jgi:hypothetical protein
MAYVQRDTNLNIVGVFANLQKGFAEELLDNNDPQVVAFIASVNKSMTPVPLSSMTVAQRLATLNISKSDLQTFLGLPVTATVSV